MKFTDKLDQMSAKEIEKFMECKMEGCGGFKHCKNREFDPDEPDCQECADDSNYAMHNEE